MKGRLALTKDGKLTYCKAKPDNFGKGKCNHVEHMKDEESEDAFISRIELGEKSNDGNAVKSEDLNAPYAGEPKYLPASYENDGTLNLSEQPNQLYFKGVQLKGMVTVVNEDGTCEDKFVKFDSINPKENGEFYDFHDFKYSSVSESLVSAFIDASENDALFESVSYDFEKFNVQGKVVTGTLSNPYNKGGIEIILSQDDRKIKNPADNFILESNEEYVQGVVDCPSNDLILKNMTNYLKMAGVNESDAKHFIIQQAGFDMLMGNKDRKENPSNFVVVQHPNGMVKPVNMDYGRCLFDKKNSPHLKTGMWSKNQENNQQMDDENIEFMAETSMNGMLSDNGIFSSGMDYYLKKNVDFIMDNGFQPFVLDKKKMHDKMDSIIEKTHGTEMEKYTKFKVKIMKQMLQNENLNRLWVDINEQNDT